MRSDGVSSLNVKLRSVGRDLRCLRFWGSGSAFCDADFLQVLQARNSLTPRDLAPWSALIPDQQAAQVTAEAQC